MSKQLVLSFLFLSIFNFAKAQDLPNILWLTSEDNSTFLGCYGDTNAITPNLDNFAKNAILYENAFANTPVCAPARSTLISGCYASSMGTEPMRSRYEIPASFEFYPEILKKKGYYCTNNSKTDYNLVRKNMPNDASIWDESSRQAHYKNRESGQPFFAIFNTTITHESCLHKTHSKGNFLHRPEDMNIAAYHPSIPVIQNDYAQYYDQVTLMDNWFGEKLKELEEAGLLDNTIVFYYSDHGGVLARSKRFLYESGTQVPLIVHIPEKYKHLAPHQSGTRTDQVVSFVDFAPTLLSLIGQKQPDNMQGKPFLGKYAEEKEHAYLYRARMDECLDMSRAIRDKKYRYIRNYMPSRIYLQHINYLFKAPSAAAWKEQFLNGQCSEVEARFFMQKPAEELYLVSADRDEVNNLANDPTYEEILKNMRQVMDQEILSTRDAGFMFECDRNIITKGTTIREYALSDDYNLEAILKVANRSIYGKDTDLNYFLDLLDNKDASIRFWALCGIRNIPKTTQIEAAPNIRKKLNDSMPGVRLMAAEILLLNNKDNEAMQVIRKTLNADDDYAKTYAINIIESQAELWELFKPELKMIAKQKSSVKYPATAANKLLDMMPK